MMLDKQLARLSQECQRIDADRWRLALSKGHALTVSVRRDDGFLLLDAEAGVLPAAGQLGALVGRSREIPAAVKFAMRRHWSEFRLRAEFPLPEESDAAAETIRKHLEGMRGALYRLREWLSREGAEDGAAYPELKGDGQAIPGSLTELLSEAGWAYHERPGGALLVDLETGSQFLQAEVSHCGAGARFGLTLYRHDDAGGNMPQALCLYLLEANAALRYVRAFLRRDGEGRRPVSRCA